MSSQASSSTSPRSGTAQLQDDKATRKFLRKLIILATLGGFLFGYDTGVISGALLYLGDDLELTPLTQATVVSILLFGAMFGALGAGRVADKIGRRTVLIICAALFVIGALGSALAVGFVSMALSRLLLGFGVGAAATICPVYLAELSPADRRGRIVTINEFMIVFGAMMAFIMNAIIDGVYDGAHVWRYMLGIAVIPALFFLVGMMFLPDTPRWYVMVGRGREGMDVLRKSRPEAEAEREYQEILSHAKAAESEARGVFTRDFKAQPWMRRILWIGIGLAIAQQATGINTAIYYAPSILELTGFGTSAALIASAAVGVIGVLATILGIWLLGFMSRRALLIVGFCGVAASHAALSVSFMLPQSPTSGYFILVAMALMVAFVQCFIGIGVWLMLAEIFPIKYRGVLMGIAVFVLWTTNTIISFTFPLLIEAAGPAMTFGIFVVVNVISIIFVIKAAPETKGRSLEQIEDDVRTAGLPVVTAAHQS